MNHLPAVLSSLVALAVGGCASNDKVLFVTSTSIGINADKAPPDVSIAYSRTEGFIGPRLGEGAIPPVIASIESNAKIFKPVVRQVYATGDAARYAAKAAKRPADDVKPLVGDPSKNKLVFFGTTSTIGLKVGFDGSGLPDSFLFGYKRKEFSVIPLARTGEGGTSTYVYPSVFASIDTTTSAIEQKETGLETKQFFATGVAAEALAAGKAGEKLNEVANKTMASALSAADLDLAVKNARILRTTLDAKLTTILSVVATDNKLDSQVLGELIDKVNGERANTIPSNLKNVTSAAELRRKLLSNIDGTNKLYEYLTKR